ncbi:MAG: THUMP domain-containing protein [Euryarchaeota archaeon]|nr:THUMP domain-containing protein [Euryarchaeota archaeon]
MDVILVRYAEVGLKSRGVRSRFERILIDNMMSILAHDGIEAIIACDHGRIFVETADARKAGESVRRVFGVASISIARKITGGLKEFRDAVAEYSLSEMSEGQTFKIEARRTGTHPFTSMQAAAELGEAVLMANESRDIKVDLHHPDVTIYAEIRENQCYIFSTYLDGPAGFPMSSQGKVLAVLENERDSVAAWLIMKRGCRCVVMGHQGAIDILRRWDPELKVVEPSDPAEAAVKYKAAAVVYGLGVNDIKRISTLNMSVPVFYPLVGMDDEEIERRLASII